VPHPLGILAVCRPPVAFDSLDGESVDLVALILAPPDRPGQHLGDVSRWSDGLVRRLADADFSRRLRQAGSAAEIEELLQAADGGMTRREWLTCIDPQVILGFLEDRGLLTERKARLFGTAVCRRLWDLLDDARSWDAVAVAERFAAGLASAGELEVAYAAQACCLERPAWQPATEAAEVAELVAADKAVEVVAIASITAKQAMATAGNQDWNREVWDAEQQAQSDLLRDLFGPLPFRKPHVEPHWRTPLVVSLAQAAYEER
jgi:hypothetical protein